VPLTAAEPATRLAQEGFCFNERDTEGLLRDLVVSGEIVELDAAAGFRWQPHAASAA
jgi:hypothetical protein